MLHKDFFVVVLLDKGLLPRERRWWHHLNWLSLCPGETKASSHPGGVRPLRGKGAVVCVSVCICVLCALCPYMCVFVCGNLASPFILYGFWSNIANIVAEGELHKETMECGPHVCKSGYRSLTAFPTALSASTVHMLAFWVQRVKLLCQKKKSNFWETLKILIRIPKSDNATREWSNTPSRYFQGGVRSLFCIDQSQETQYAIDKKEKDSDVGGKRSGWIQSRTSQDWYLFPPQRHA